MVIRTVAAVAIVTLTLGAQSDAVPPPSNGPAPIQTRMPALPSPRPTEAKATPLPLNDTVVINVPVHVKELTNDFTQGMVQCSFRYVGGAYDIYGTQPESAIVAFPLSNGGFDGIVPVTLMRSNTPPDKINGYFCDLELYSSYHGTAIPGPVSGFYYPKKGTKFVPHVEGSF